MVSCTRSRVSSLHHCFSLAACACHICRASCGLKCAADSDSVCLQVALQAEAIVKELTQQDDGAKALSHNITVNMHALL